MFLAGWVHRDVSTANILFYKGRGLIADLEYAKKEGLELNVEYSNSQKDPKTVCYRSCFNLLAN